MKALAPGFVYRLRLSISTGLILLGLMTSTALSAEMMVQLTDGSRLQGEVVSMSGGVYVLRTASMGDVRIPANKIEVMMSSSGTMEMAPVPPVAESAFPATTAADASMMGSITARLAGDAGLMASVMQLQNSPEMQEILRDPEVMKAVQSFDLTALANNPKIKALMNNPEIRKIQGKVN